MKRIYARKLVEPYLDEEERSIEDETSYEEDFVVEKEETQGDGNNTPVQTKLGLDINMIGAIKETLGNHESNQRNVVSKKKIDGKSRSHNGRLDSRNLPDFSSDIRTN